jgi:hypothetical protein
MAQAMTENKQALRAAKDMVSSNGEIREWGTRGQGGRYEFEYEGAVNAHLLDEEWRLSGFGSGWFALHRDE